MVKFVVLTSQRSGSTFFCKSLDLAPQIRCMEECFHTEHPAYPTFAPFLSRFLLKPEDFHGLPKQTRCRLLCEFLDQAYESNTKAVGFKLHYVHLETYPEILSWMKHRSVRVIHLLRRNQLKRLLSWIVKQHWGQLYSSRSTHSFFSQPLPQARIRIRCHGLLSLLQDMEAQCKQYQQAFSTWEHYMEVFYEDSITFRDREAARIATFLGLRSLDLLEPDILKINSDSIKNIVVNYNEMADVLKGTRFYRYLDEKA